LADRLDNRLGEPPELFDWLAYSRTTGAMVSISANSSAGSMAKLLINLPVNFEQLVHLTGDA